jgi:hypothetical protein
MEVKIPDGLILIFWPIQRENFSRLYPVTGDPPMLTSIPRLILQTLLTLLGTPDLLLRFYQPYHSGGPTVVVFIQIQQVWPVAEEI